jgi:hypothetical protein
MTALAEVQIAALDCGFAGVHLPLHELMRLRAGARLEARHLSVNEFLCERYGTDGASGFAGLEAGEEGAPFRPPEIPSGEGDSLRRALAYRLAAQIHVLLEGRLAAEDAAFADAGKTVAIATIPAAAPLPTPQMTAADVPRELVRLGLSPRPESRPDPDDFLAVRLPFPKPA